MNKQEAAEFLQVSVRALERYVQQGKISVKYEKGKTRSTANFDQSELEAFKQELNQPSYKPALESRQNAPTATNTESGQNATEANPDIDTLTLHEFDQVEPFGEISPIDGMAIIEKLVNMLAGHNHSQASVPIADKVLLTLAEAQALTGLSREFLRTAITEGGLKAKLIGRTWRLKRSDVDEYVNNLF